MKSLVVVTWLSVLGLTAHSAAQSGAGSRFEVASVKPSNPNAVGPGGLPVLPTTRQVGGRFIASNITLRALVKDAYDFYFDFRIEGGPDWQTSRRFDVQATAEDPAADRVAMRPMLRALLADRFKLKVHTEMREMPVFALVVARPGNDDRRLGPNLTPSTADCSNPAPVSGADITALLQAGKVVPCAIMPAPARVAGSYTERANGVSMAALASSLTAQTGRVVHDRTGLSGLYDWELTYDRSIRGLATAPSTSDSPVLTTALQEQLGLKLESTRGPVEVLVIDSAELPGPD